MKNALIITNLSNSFPALKYKNFRYFWFGQCISLIGTWMQITALQWLVYTTTKSALLLGFLGVAQFGPVMVFSLFAGVIVDRYPKKKILIFTQSALMLQAVILALLVFLGHIVYWEILVLAIFSGFMSTLDMPARQSFIHDLVAKKHLGSAIGLNMAVFNSARIIGPAISALLMVRFGPGLLFFFNGISFIPVIFYLYRIDVVSVIVRNIKKKVFSEILEGLQLIRQSSTMLNTIFAVLALGTFILNFNVIIPIYAVEVLKQGVSGYGMLLSALGIGSLVGSLVMAAIEKEETKIQRLFASALIASLLLVVLNFVHSLILAALLLVIIGFSTLVFLSTANLTLQLHSSDAFRGRVMSVYSFALLGSTPIGNLFAGSISEKYGSGMGFLLCGAITGFFIILIGINYLIKQRANQKYF
ncbi:MAG: MFS transporter [Acetobacterium sp.]